MKITHRVVNRRLALIAGVLGNLKLEFEVTPNANIDGWTKVTIKGKDEVSLSFHVESMEVTEYNMEPEPPWRITLEGLRACMNNLEALASALARCVTLVQDTEALEDADWLSIDTDPQVRDVDRHLLRSAVIDPTSNGNWGQYWTHKTDRQLVIRDLLKADYLVLLPLVRFKHLQLSEAEFEALQEEWKNLEPTTE